MIISLSIVILMVIVFLAGVTITLLMVIIGMLQRVTESFLYGMELFLQHC